MDYSAANAQLWNPIIQIGIIAATILVANVLRRKVPFIKKSLLPTAVLGGFVLLALRLIGLVKLDMTLMENLTYHCIAIGFIALSLRIPDPDASASVKNVGVKSGAMIVATYMVQAVTGLTISILLGYTLMPNLFKASGILLPMGYGQGPGQANNIGSSYESLGFAGGRSFGLAIAATGYIVACVVGVFYINYLVKKGKFERVSGEQISGSVTIDEFQSHNEVPIAESLDRLSIQVCLVLVVYLITYLVTWGLTSAFTAISVGLGNTLNSLLWGFNFIFGSAFAMLLRVILMKMKKVNIVTRQYQNNYLLNRISGLAFDIMIVAGIASIEPEDLSGLWVPFLLMTVIGAALTLVWLKYACKIIYKGYYYEGLISMYGMLTGTISSGVLLLRELDPQLKTPAANNLVLGSSFGILFGIPMLALVSLAPKSTTMLFVAFALLAAYFFLLLFIVKKQPKEKKAK